MSSTQSKTASSLLVATVASSFLIAIAGSTISRYSRDKNTRLYKGCKAIFEEDEDLTSDESVSSSSSSTTVASTKTAKYDLLPCIRKRRSIFPNQYLQNPPELDPAVIDSLLEAARWAPYHGKSCSPNCAHPARFVVLGRQAIVTLQELTLSYYDRNWQTVGWGSRTSASGATAEDYQTWRDMTQGEITGRWAPCTHMIAIIAQRQSGPKRYPMWEELAATAAAVQNMHLQSTQFPYLACYWSSWHESMRDSEDMKDFLNMGPEDVCMGFFIVAQVKHHFKDRRQRDKSLLKVERRS